MKPRKALQKIKAHIEARDNRDMACDGPVGKPSYDELLEDVRYCYRMAKKGLLAND